MELQIEQATASMGNKILFENLSMRCSEREIVCILGPNGAGKTTFLRHVLGFLPLTSGRCLWDKKEIHPDMQKEFWKQVGYVPQREKDTDVWSLTAEEAMLTGRCANGGFFSMPGKEDKKAVEEWITRLGIEALKGRLCSRMSGGELQLVRIGRALVKNPKMLVVDEPETGLDPQNRLKLSQLFLELRDAYDMQMLINTHDPEYAADTADRILLLDGRGGWRFGDKAQLLTSQALEWAYHVKVASGYVSDCKKEVQYIRPYA